MVRKIKKYVIVALFFGLLTCQATSLAQNKNTTNSPKIVQLKHLPQNDVNEIFADHNGFMWIGTLDGLFRYDGYGFKTYRIDQSKNAISSNLIIDIDEDSKGNIWIATYDKGLCKLDPVTERFTWFQNTKENPNLFASNDITTMIVDDQDVIWIGNYFGTTRVRFDEAGEEIIDIQLIKNYAGIENQNRFSVKMILQDKRGYIWMGTNRNLICCKNPHEKISDLRFESYPRLIHWMCEEGDNLVVGGAKSAILSPVKNEENQDWDFKIKSFSVTNISRMHYAQNSLWLANRYGVRQFMKDSMGEWDLVNHFTSKINEEGLGSNIVTALASDPLGRLWVGMRGGGITIISFEKDQFEHYQKTEDKGSLANNICREIFEDSRGNLWIGMEEKGVCVLPYQKETNYATGFKTIQINAPELFSDRVYAIEEILTPRSEKRRSILWMGTSYPNALVPIDPVTFEKLSAPQFVSQIGFVFALEYIGNNMMLAGTYSNGLYLLWLDDDGNITSLKNFLPSKSDPNSLSSVIIRSLLMDSGGDIWIGTDKGLNRTTLEELTGPIPRFTVYEKGTDSTHLNHDYILQIYEANDGVIWIGTMGGGLLSYTKTSQNEGYFSKITTRDGLPNNAVKAIEEDRKGRLWLSTNYGLSRFDPKTKEIVNYDESDGLQYHEFSEISSVKRKNGQFVFGGIKGFNVFYPDKIETDTVKPKLFLTDFKILNKQVNPGDTIHGNVILKKSIAYTKSVRLRYSENSFSFGFVGIHFNAPQKNKYKYKLEGFDEEWINQGAEYRIANYTNIPTGEYTFKVQCSNSDNVWSDEIASVHIIIDPPIYKSAQAFIIYFVLTAIMLYLLLIIANNRTRRKKDMQIANLEKDQMEEMSQMKLRFFTNISHEFRTPLTLIKVPLDKLLKYNNDYTPIERKHNLSLIQHNVNVMMRLINQLMDFRKIDQQKMSLKAGKYDLVSFLEAIYQSFTQMAERSKINFHFKCNLESLDVWYDAEKLEKILYNLLSNAFKFTKEEGEISMELVSNKDTLTIAVEDNGNGIDEEEQKHIFERYYQSERKRSHVGGTGIGLSLCKSLVEMHRGKIWFESALEEGTRFFVELPLGNSHLKDDEIINTNGKIELLSKPVSVTSETADTGNVSSVKDSGSKAKILIVEDNSELRQVLVELFGSEYNVDTAEDGLQGLEKSREDFPDLIVSDLMMPNMDGLEMCRQIKSSEETSHIPLLLLTAKDTVESEIKGFETGADDYLTKPFDPDVLQARVQAMIKNRERLRQRFQKEIEINPGIIANNSADSRFMDRILEIIEENLSDSDFSVEHLADKYGVSRVYLNRKIKALVGETSNQFIRNIRLKHAAEQLKRGDFTVSEVTWNVGYNDLRTFRKRFKDKFGMSPSEFVKEHREN